MSNKKKLFIGAGALASVLIVGTVLAVNHEHPATSSKFNAHDPEIIEEVLSPNNKPLFGDEMTAEEIQKAFIPDMPGEYEYTDDSGEIFTYSEGYVLEARSDEVWRATVIQFMKAYALPDGIFFPSTAPLFFKPGELSLIETGEWEDHALSYDLFRQFAAKYWTCAWIETQIDAEQEGNNSLFQIAQANISQYESVPGTEAKYAGYQGFKDSLMDEAKNDEFTYNQLWFNFECKTYEMEKVKR